MGDVTDGNEGWRTPERGPAQPLDKEEISGLAMGIEKEGQRISYLASLRSRHPIIVSHGLLRLPERHSLRPVPAFQTDEMAVADSYSSKKTVVEGNLGFRLRVLMEVVASKGGPGVGRDEHCKRGGGETQALVRGSGIYASPAYIAASSCSLTFGLLILQP